MNGPECRGTALALNISVNMIRCYLKKLEPKQIAQHVESGTKVVISCEADEQWSFVRCKSNPYGLFYAYDRTRKRILARIFDALEMR